MGRHGRISYLWQQEDIAEDYVTGVSLHSHTNQSRETLDFIAELGRRISWLQPVMTRMEARARRRHSVTVNYAEAYWTPPLTPKLAFDLESNQIARLGLQPLVSISDHDTISAPMLLRTVASARHIPVSVEWSVPYGGDQSFHLGIHNLPSDEGQSWMSAFAEFTAQAPVLPDANARLTELLAALHALPNVLIVFNHPLWDLYMVGAARHTQLLHEFMAQNGAYIHALELNGLRDWKENRAVRGMAAESGKLLISGGDRHGMEPNANINLTNASSFTEFVHEVRYEGRSHVLFMPQYAEPIKHRILQSTLDAIRSYPEFPQGSRTWDERTFHPGPDGTPTPLAELWPSGAAPAYMQRILGCIRLLGSRPLSGGLRMAWSERAELQVALGE
jgi:hypothetical protein